MTLRLTEEQLAEFQARRKAWEATGQVRTHLCEDPNPAAVRAPTTGTPRPPRKREPRQGVGLPKVGRPRKVSEIESLLAQQLALMPDLPEVSREYKHIPNRDFRLDFAWPGRRIGIEVQGMVHRIKGRFKNDIEKRALGLMQGWRVLEVGGDEIRSGVAARWIIELWNQPTRNP